MRPTRKRAFSLIEVTIALGIASFGLLVLFGLLLGGLNLSKESTDMGIAVNVLTMLASDLQSVDVGANTTTRFAIPFQSGAEIGLLGSGAPIFFDANGKWLPGSSPASLQEAMDGGAYFMGSLRIQEREKITGTPAQALLVVSWPPLVDSPRGSVELLLALPKNPGIPSDP